MRSGLCCSDWTSLTKMRRIRLSNLSGRLDATMVPYLRLSSSDMSACGCWGRRVAIDYSSEHRTCALKM